MSEEKHLRKADKIQDILDAIASGKIKVDVCSLNKDLKDLKIYYKDSASPTEVLFAYLIKEHNAKRIRIPIALKIFIIQYDNNTDYRGLIYEKDVYEKVITKIARYSPNFVQYVGYGDCSRKTIQTWIEDEDVLWKRMRANISGKHQNRFGILITRKPNRDGERIGDLTDFFNANRENKDKLHTVLFQIIYSLAVMGQFRLVHNDLHTGNILVVEHTKPVRVIYEVGGKKFFIHTNFVPYIFDWDHAYCDELGNNPLLTKAYCAKYNICNRFSPKTDLYILLCYLNFGSIVDLGKDYFNRAINLKEENKQFLLEKAEVKRIEKFEPYIVKDRYKMGMKQLQDVFGEKALLYFGPVHSVIFELSGRHLRIISGHSCRPTTFIDKMKTPLEYLEGDYFDNLLLKEGEEIKEGENISVYKFPYEVRTPKRIYIDPFIPSTRKKIEGKPRFPRKDLDSVKEDDKEEVKVDTKKDIKTDVEYDISEASANGDLDRVKYLVKKGVKVTVDNNKPLRYASRNGHLEVVRFLIEKGSDVTDLDNKALRYASENGHVRVVKYLVKHGADINDLNDEAICIASQNGHLEMVKYLVKHGANIKAQNNYPIRKARQNGHYDIVEYLKKAKLFWRG